jgi:hypothetical protein
MENEISGLLGLGIPVRSGQDAVQFMNSGQLRISTEAGETCKEKQSI